MRNLLSSMADFVPCDLKLQRAYSTSKFVKSEAILTFGWPPGLGKGFLVGKGKVVSKGIYEGSDFCGFIAGFNGKDCVFYGP